MENAIAVGLSSQMVLIRSLDIVANNVANQSTTGFKAEQATFNDYVSRVNGETAGDNTVSLVHDNGSYTDFSAGGVDQTGASLDFSIDGDGFFALETENGIRFSRDGKFSLNEFGELTNRNGALVLDDGNSPILIDRDAGPLLASDDGGLQQDGVVIAQLGVFDVANRNGLKREGENLFSTNEDPSLVENIKVRQGFVERSNVNPLASVTQMIEIMRAYEGASRLVETSNDLARDAVRTLTRDA